MKFELLCDNEIKDFDYFIFVYFINIWLYKFLEKMKKICIWMMDDWEIKFFLLLK